MCGSVYSFVGAAALLFWLLKAGNMSSLSLEKTYDVVTEFDNIGGLKPNTAVKSAGGGRWARGEIRFDDKKFKALVV